MDLILLISYSRVMGREGKYSVRFGWMSETVASQKSIIQDNLLSHPSVDCGFISKNYSRSS